MTVCVTNNVSLLNQLVIISHIFTYIFICYFKQMTVILEIGIFTKVKIRISSIVCGKILEQNGCGIDMFAHVLFS